MSRNHAVLLSTALGASLVAVLVLSILAARQRTTTVRLESQVHDLQSRPCVEPVEEPCECEPREGLLRVCTASLEKARARLERAGSDGPDPGDEPPAGSESGRYGHDSSEQGEAAGHPGALQAAAAAGGKQRVRELFGDKLGIAEQQMQSLGSLVCATMALREALLDDYAQGGAGAEQTWQELTALREDLTDEMKEVLGPERYEAFRAAGGIGALASTIDCEQMNP